jgi:predicted GNAT family acetyltransferase
MGGRIIFKRIRGRIVPIKIESRVASEIGDSSKKILTVRASGKRRLFGSMRTDVSPYKRAARVQDTLVNDKVRGAGLSTELFRETLEKLKGMKFKSLAGEVQHPAQVKIRAKFKSRFYDQYSGPHGDRFKLMGAKEAESTVKKKGYIMAVTRIPKKGK